jgi:hypothetical protein
VFLFRFGTTKHGTIACPDRCGIFISSIFRNLEKVFKFGTLRVLKEDKNKAAKRKREDLASAKGLREEATHAAYG